MTDLSSIRVLVVGAGGLGCPASLALARAGVGALTMIDPDVVDVTNLHRQLWHRSDDLGRPKVDSAREKLERAFSALRVSAHRARVDASNVDALFRDHDLVIDGTDGVEVKFLLSDAAVRTRVPFVYGGVLRMTGQVMLIAPGGPCLRCLFEAPPAADAVPTCAQAGVLGSMAGVIGGMQAQVAVRWLRSRLDAPPQASTRLQIFDGVTFTTRRVSVGRAPECSMCGDAARGDGQPPSWTRESSCAR